MTAAAPQIVLDVAAAGGRLTASGDRLTVAAPKPLPGALVAELRQHKPEILAYLTHVRHEADDWAEWVAERAAILEYDGGLPRAEAECRAFQHALVEWSNRHPPQADPNRCAGCGGAINEAGSDWRPLGDGATVHYSGEYGLRCLEVHGVKRREEACKALVALGLTPAAGTGNT